VVAIVVFCKVEICRGDKLKGSGSICRCRGCRGVAEQGDEEDYCACHMIELILKGISALGTEYIV
jgi:hypothetical protein